jgi:Mrp family chromosome partitioning ATPase
VANRALVGELEPGSGQDDWLAPACCLIQDMDQPRIVELIAAHAGEGTSTIARGLAATAAAILRSDVLLVDASSGPPSLLHRPGLADGPAGPASIGAAVTACAPGVHRARLVSSGIRPELLRRPGLSPLWDLLRARYALTILDAPALESGIDGIALAAQVDSVLVVVEAEKTRAPVVQRLMDLLRRAGAPVAGAILNKRRFYIPSFLYDHV